MGAKTEKCHEYIVMIAALLHDTDDIKIFGTKNYENARWSMVDCHLTADIMERVIDIIREISFKGMETTTPKSIEGKIVQDAMGAIGRVTYGGKKPGSGEGCCYAASPYTRCLFWKNRLRRS